MDAALVASALLMGATGSLHCAAMCGPAFAAAAGAGNLPTSLTAAMPLHAGRLVSYAAAGALVASSVSALGTMQEAGPLLRPVWTLIHVAAVVLGASLVLTGQAPRWLSRRPAFAGRAGSRIVRVHARMPPAGRSALIGLCWGGLPCGLLQAALLVAALASGPAGGAMVMAAFAIASSLGLWAGPFLWTRLGAGAADARGARLVARLAGALLVITSGWALWHGLGSLVAQICSPLPGAG